MNSYWDRYTAARISRRTLLRSAAIASAAGGAIAIAGCGSSKHQAPVATTRAGSASNQPDVLNVAGPPRRGGTFTTANSANFGTFDPHLGIQVASAYFPRVYNVLLNQSATKPEFMFMDLAQSFEIPDETTYVFKIRPGVKIAPNGLGVPERDLDAEDVKVTLERIANEPASNNYGFAKQYIASIVASGDSLTIKTTGPYAWFLNRIGLFFNCIAPRELLTGDLSRLTTHAAGAGPYRLMSVSEGEVAQFERNPNYYRTDDANGGAPLPYVDKLEVRVIFDRATQRTAFQSGQIQLYWTASGDEARSLGDSAVIARDPSFGYVSLTMNPKKKPFDDPRVRRAISRAINRKEYVDIVYHGDARPNGLVHWPLGSYAFSDDELDSTYQPFSVADARDLVQQVGGIKIKMMYPAGTSIEEHSAHLAIFLEQMKAANIEIDQDPQDFGTWVSNYHDLNYDCSLALNQTYETPELPLGFHSTGGPFGDRTYIQGLGDADIDSAISTANQTLAYDARLEAVHAAQRVIYEKDPMFLPIVSPYLDLAYSPRVKNIPAGVGTTAYFLNSYWLDS